MTRTGTWQTDRTVRFERIAEQGGSGESSDFQWSYGANSAFESGAVVEATERATPTAELIPVSDVHVLEPEGLPLREAWTVAITARAGSNEKRVGLYRRSGANWSWIGAERDPTGAWTGRSRRLGGFALYRDERAPRITILRPVRAGRDGPYSRWALEARVDEQGSGVNAERSQLLVDGRPVPTEWDPETRRLRWRPLNPPARGAHSVHVHAVDAAGNSAEATGRFSID
jgi:hypothetical protein